MKKKSYLVKNLVVGIVYRYFLSKTGESYVGCTINESKRKSAWRDLKHPYAGGKVEKARNKYGPGVFSYERICLIIDDSKDNLMRRLEALEAFCIKKYDSFNNGFNMNEGGHGNRGLQLSTEHKENIRKASKKKPIICIPIDGSEPVRYESMMEASRKLGKSISVIYNYCHKYSNKLLKGYKLELAA